MIKTIEIDINLTARKEEEIFATKLVAKEFMLMLAI